MSDPAAEVRRLERRCARERAARQDAEAIAERATRELYGAVRRSDAILQATPDLVAVADARGACLYLNTAARDLLGLDLDAPIAHLPLRDILPAGVLARLAEDAVPSLVLDGVWRGELTLTPPSGRALPVSVVALAHRGLDGEVEYCSAIARDITDRKAMEERLTYAIEHDALTGLPNRAVFLDRLARALDEHGEHGAVAVLLCDLDRFKVVNDSLGHAFGDRLLVLAAQRLRGILRANNLLARFGSDEFTVLCDDLASPQEALAVAARIADAYTEPFVVDQREVFLTVSVGIAVAADGDEAEGLVRDADAAMYRAKEHGRARCELFDDALRIASRHRLETEHDLRRALERGELRVVYQPCVRLDDGAVTGFEALVRWQHPRRGLVAPADFIGVAEETGLIRPIGAWVLAEACRQAARWPRTPDPEAAQLTVSVNLSAAQLQDPELSAMVADILVTSRLDPAALCLEITETVALESTAETTATLDALRVLGVRLAIDDFGTGYSSLDYLRRFRMHVLKIDRSLVQGLDRDHEAAALTTAAVRIAEALGLVAVAEGVETAEEHRALLALGCHFAQGYHFARPLPLEAVHALLAGRQTAVLATT